MAPGGDCETSLEVHLEPSMLSEATSEDTIWPLYLEAFLKYVSVNVPGNAVELMKSKVRCCLTTITEVICRKNGKIWGRVGWCV